MAQGSRKAARQTKGTVKFARLWHPVLFDADLSHGACRLYAALEEYTYLHGDDVTDIDLEAAAGAIGASLRSVKSWVAELERKTLVTVERRPGKTSIYTVKTPSWEPVQNLHDPGAKSAPPHAGASTRERTTTDKSHTLPQTRQRARTPKDDSFDAMVEATNATLPRESGRIGQALKDIREGWNEYQALVAEGKEDVAEAALALEIPNRAEEARQSWSDRKRVTPTALASNWNRLRPGEAEAKRRGGGLTSAEISKTFGSGRT